MAGPRDVIVLGADIEGLVAAAFLSRADRAVCVVDGGAGAGGAAARDEFHPGYTAPGLLHESAGVRRRLLAPLALENHGLAWREDEPPLFIPSAEGRGLLVHPSPGRMAEELSAGDPLDLASYGRWRTGLRRLAPLVRKVLDEPPPPVADPGARDLLRLGQRAWELRRLGAEDMHELLRIVAMSAEDWLTENFRHHELRAGLASQAMLGTVLGPRAAGTALLLLLRECAADREPVGGAAGLVDALEKSVRSRGVELRLGEEVESIRIGPDGVEGVQLASGERISAKVVLSTADPTTTFRDWIPPAHLPSDLRRAAERWRRRGAQVAVRFALSRPPAFRGREEATVERAISASNTVELERTSDHVKYRRLPDPVHLDVRVPSANDPSLAPEGHAVVTALVHGVAAALDEGWTDGAREVLGRRALDALDRLAPGARDTVVATEVLDPPTVRARYGATAAHLYGGELALDQAWIRRPSLALSRYATTLPGLFLGGACCHPGGPFLGGAGALAAAMIAKT